MTSFKDLMTHTKQIGHSIFSEGGIVKLLSDPFFYNSAYMLVSIALSSIFGLLFWVIAARYFPMADVGVATAIISIATLIIALSRLGIDQALIRYFPSGDKSKIFSVTILLTTVLALFMSVFFILTTKLFLKDVSLDPFEAIAFIGFILFYSIFNISSYAFNSQRKSKFVLVQNVVLGSRLLLLIPLCVFGLLGILGSMFIAYALTVFFSLFVLRKMSIWFTRPDWNYFKRTFDFSLGNYLSGILSGLPALLLPMLVLSMLSAEDAARYYMAYSIASIVLVVPSAFSLQLFVEGSHGEGVQKTTRKAMISSIGVLAPVIIVLWLLGGYLLDLMGTSYYTGGIDTMRLMLIAGVFITFFQTYMAVQRVKKDVKGMVLLSAANCVLVLCFCYVLASWYGLIGVGGGWMAGYGLSLIISAAYEKKYRMISS